MNGGCDYKGMSGFSRRRPSRLVPALLMFLLLSGFLFLPLQASMALAPTTAGPSSSVPHGIRLPPSLMNHERDGAPPSRVREAVPMYVTLNQTVEVKSQTTGSFLYYSPLEIREAYNATSLLNSGYDGTGVTISIVDAYGDPFIQSELDTFSSTFGIPSTHVNVVCVDGPCDYSLGLLTGWNEEIALDVEWAHAMAPGATINLYIGSNAGTALFDAVAAAVAGTNGNGTYLSPSSVISLSWGIPENDFGSSVPVLSGGVENYPWLNQVLQQAAAQGITVFAAAGDWGAYDQGLYHNLPYGGAAYPSTDPFVTGVGGTSLYLRTSAGYLQYPFFNASSGYGYETAWSWNNYYGWGTGGGYSSLFAQPYWQSGGGIGALGGRGAPDVAWEADVQTGVVVFVDGHFTIYGGTSLGAPSWAGAMALIDQKAGRSIGPINPILYSIHNDPSASAKAFHDVIVGNSDPLSATRGWDPLTGLGTPNIGELSIYLARPSGSLKVVTYDNIPVNETCGCPSVWITAKAFDGASEITTGTGSLTIEDGSGAVLGVVPMTYDSGYDKWTGLYYVQPSDPRGMWTARVDISSGSLSGSGMATFEVGDGVTIVQPWGWYRVGDTIPVQAIVTGSTGLLIESGSFNATFLYQTPEGPVEGTVPLHYDSGNGDWEGSLLVGPSVDQGAWVLTVGGADSFGQHAAPAYSWLNVGLFAFAATDSPTYTLGDVISIAAYIEASCFCGPATSGAFSAEVWEGATLLASVPLVQNGVVWTGSYAIGGSDPTGFYRIVVTGNDGSVNSASAETLVRVAPYNLTVDVSVPGSEFLSNATIPLMADVRYPNGSSVTVGSVELLLGGSEAPMTFDETLGKFVGILNVTGMVGRVSAQAVAFDPMGSYGLGGTSFNLISVSSTSVDCGTQYVPLFSAFGTAVECKATVTGYAPTGTVTWSVSQPGHVLLGATACTLVMGQCSIQVAGSAVGDVTLKAVYGGDSNDTSSRAAQALDVSPVAVRCSPSELVVGASVKCAVKVAGSLIATGTVSWSSDTGGVFSRRSCTLVGSMCVVKFSTRAAGAAAIYASYSGNRVYSPDMGGVALQVDRKIPKMSVVCTPKSVLVGVMTAVTCKAQLKGYAPTGEVVWPQSGDANASVMYISPASCSLVPGSSCAKWTNANTLTVKMTGFAYGAIAGPVNVTAVYLGDANNARMLANAILTFKPVKTAISVACAPTLVLVGGSTTCTATLKNYFGSVSGETILWSRASGTGSVTLSSASCVLSQYGTCSVTITGTAQGQVGIKATYMGDAANKASKCVKTVSVK